MRTEMLTLSPIRTFLPLSSSPIFSHQFHHFNLHVSSLSFNPLPIPVQRIAPKLGPISCLPSSTTTAQPQEGAEEEEDFQVLTAIRSEYNNIVMLESQNAKVLLLDDSGNIHSLLYKGQQWTDSYWDEFCSLPPIIPAGPVAIFGLGGGTVAHQLLHFWPTLCIHGWELDEILVDNARQFFGVSELEVPNQSGGFLQVYVGDALSSLANVEGGYAGIVVDLFSNAKVVPQLEEVETWMEMKDKLMPGGRIMVNCGGALPLGSHHEGEIFSREWEVNLSIKAMCGAFGNERLNWKKMPQDQSGNYLAFTGVMPELETWSSAVPDKLSSSVKLWRPCE